MKNANHSMGLPPKGAATKRASTAPKEPKSPAKAVRRTSPTDLIIDAVNHPLAAADMTEDCRRMLIGAIPKSLGVAAGQRHDIQNEVIEMFGELLDSIAKKLQDAIEEESAKVADVEQTKQSLADTVARASSALEELEEVAKTRTASLASMTEATASATSNLEDKKRLQAAYGASLQALLSEKSLYQAAVSDHLEPLKKGEIEAADVSKHVNELMQCAVKLNSDSSLLQAMPSSFSKTPEARGPFDIMVLAQLEENFLGRIKELDASVEASSPERQAAEDAVAAASSALSGTQADERRAVEALEAALQARDSAVVAKADAEASAIRHVPAYERATAHRDAARMEAAAFGATMRAFAELRGDAEHHQQ